MLPDRVSNPGPLTYESGALPIPLRGPCKQRSGAHNVMLFCIMVTLYCQTFAHKGMQHKVSSWLI